MIEFFATIGAAVAGASATLVACAVIIWATNAVTRVLGFHSKIIVGYAEYLKRTKGDRSA